jgi:hypothetical protein
MMRPPKPAIPLTAPFQSFNSHPSRWLLAYWMGMASPRANSQPILADQDGDVVVQRSRCRLVPIGPQGPTGGQQRDYHLVGQPPSKQIGNRRVWPRQAVLFCGFVPIEAQLIRFYQSGAVNELLRWHSAGETASAPSTTAAMRRGVMMTAAPFAGNASNVQLPEQAGHPAAAGHSGL